MNIAFVNSSYRLGGAETVVHDLMTGCAERGHRVRLYVGFGKTYPRDSRLRPLYPRVLSRLDHSRLQPFLERVAPRFDWTDRRFRSLASGWPDLVHVHNFHGDYASVESLAFLARRKPLVWTLHGHWGFTGGCDHPLDCTRFEDACGQCPRLGVWPLSTVDGTAAQLQLKTDHLGAIGLRVVAPSRFLAERVSRSRVGRGWHVHHIPNGVPLEKLSARRKHDPAFRRSLGLDPSAVIILVVNRNFQDAEKGFRTIRDALMAMPPTRLPLQVVLAGQASNWAATELPPTVQPVSLGYVDSKQRMSALYEASDIFLFASPAETFPCVILEAMASGCCVVATPTSGVTEQIEDGHTGALAASISGADLARTLKCVLDDAALRNRVAGAAINRIVSEFSIDRTVERHLRLYRELTGTRGIHSGTVASPAAPEAME